MYSVCSRVRNGTERSCISSIDNLIKLSCLLAKKDLYSARLKVWWIRHRFFSSIDMNDARIDTDEPFGGADSWRNRPRRCRHLAADFPSMPRYFSFYLLSFPSIVDNYLLKLVTMTGPQHSKFCMELMER